MSRLNVQQKQSFQTTFDYFCVRLLPRYDKRYISP